jgi:long-chain acyl-CoA synthetase
MMLLTSATTGKAKGVMLTAGISRELRCDAAWLGLDRDTTILCALPLYNTSGSISASTPCCDRLHDGAAARFDADRCVATIADIAAPSCRPSRRCSEDRRSSERDPETLGSLRTIMTGGAPVPSPLLRRLLDVAPGV